MRSIPPGQKWPGFFFCLASAEGVGLLFLPCCNTNAYKCLQGNAVYTEHAAKPHTGLYRGIPCNLTHSTAHDTRPTQADIIPLAPRRTLHKSAQPPIIIRYIGGQRCNIPQTMPARRGQLLPSADRWQVLHPECLLRGQRLHLYRVSPAARNHWRLLPHLFSGFRPIANRGQ